MNFCLQSTSTLRGLAYVGHQLYRLNTLRKYLCGVNILCSCLWEGKDYIKGAFCIPNPHVFEIRAQQKCILLKFRSSEKAVWGSNQPNYHLVWSFVNLKKHRSTKINSIHLALRYLSLNRLWPSVQNIIENPLGGALIALNN